MRKGARVRRVCCIRGGMKDVLRLFTPPEWAGWNWAGKLGYLVIFWAIMLPVIWFARWFSSLLFG